MLNMHDRKEKIAESIKNKTIDYNTLAVIIDWHVSKGKLSIEDGEELFGLMYPVIEEEFEVVEEEVIIEE